MNFGEMNMKQLKGLQRDIEKEIERRNNADRKKVLDEVHALIKAHGLRLEDVLGEKLSRKPHSIKTDKPQKNAKLKRAPAKIKYRHPDQTNQTWTGRGRQPKWVVEWVAAGKTLDSLAI